jgi:hypothetical protein
MKWMRHVAHMSSPSVSRKTKGHVLRGSVYKAGPYQQVQTQSEEGIQNPRGRNTQQGISYEPYPRNYIAICLLFEMLCSVSFFLPENIALHKTQKWGNKTMLLFSSPISITHSWLRQFSLFCDRRVENVSTKETVAEFLQHKKWQRNYWLSVLNTLCLCASKYLLRSSKAVK